MKKSTKNSSLNEKLTSLIHTKPQIYESDDDDFTTVDKLKTLSNESDYSADEFNESKLRKINDNLLDENSKYLGRGISRKDLLDSESDFDESNENDISERLNSLTKSDSGEENEEKSIDFNAESDSEEEEKAEIDDEEPVFKKAKYDSNKIKYDDVDVNKEFLIKATKDLEKGKAVKSQLLLWDFLLNCRMKFQACLLASNQFPSYQNFVKFKGNEEFDELVLKTKKSLKHLLQSFLSLQEVLLSTNEEFINSVRSNNDQDDKDDDGSVINSDFENDSDSKDKEFLKLNFCCKQLKKLDDFAKELDRRHKSFHNYRNDIIQKWDDKTRLGWISNKNFSAFEQSVLKQIEHILLDKQRLLTRTQIRRTNYSILGENENNDKPYFKQDQLDENSSSKKNIICKEIFDDDDFYHQILSELIKRKAGDVTDPVQLGRQWMQLQKARSKMKKNVDTKASKARKIRFVVHPKLVNFMMPNALMDNEISRVELINSLFGKKKNYITYNK